MRARGYFELAERLAELVTAGRRNEALAAVPEEFIDDGWLIGPHARIGRRLAAWMDSGATGLIIRYGPQVQSGETVVENVDVFETIAKAAGKM
jgi:hypothetical protein